MTIASVMVILSLFSFPIWLPVCFDHSSNLFAFVNS